VLYSYECLLRGERGRRVKDLGLGGDDSKTITSASAPFFTLHTCAAVLKVHRQKSRKLRPLFFWDLLVILVCPVTYSFLLHKKLNQHYDSDYCSCCCCCEYSAASVGVSVFSSVTTVTTVTVHAGPGTYMLGWTGPQSTYQDCTTTNTTHQPTQK
jgi:hypothetical protein